MVYYLADDASPVDWDSFWVWAERVLEFVEGDLFGLEFETHEEALRRDYRKSLDPNDLRLDSSHLIRYRETDDRANLVHFYELGRTNFPLVQEAVERRQWTPALAQQWAILQFCHGFVTSSAFALGDDLQSKRAGAAGREATRRDRHVRWFSHYFLKVYRRGRRRDAEAAVERLILEILNGEHSDLGGFKLEWFRKMLNDEFALSSLYTDKHLSIRRMEGLKKQDTEDLPPLELKIPNP